MIYSYNPTNKQYATYQAGMGVGNNGGSNVIASGQGFFVLAGSPLATLTFNESAKTNSQVTGATLIMSKQPINAVNIQYLRLKMAADSINTDETIIHFNSGTKNTFDLYEDAPYKSGGGLVTLASLSQDLVPLAINQQPLAKAGQLITLNAAATASGAYTLSMNGIKRIPQLYAIWLKDAFTDDSVDLRKSTSYSFNIDKSNAATFGAHRFTLAIRQDTAYAYKLSAFTASRIDGSPHVALDWKTRNEQNYTNFTVERSNDGGNTFAIVGGMQGTGTGAYSLTDKNAHDGQNLYRLKQEDINNTITYSNLAEVIMNGNGNADKIHVYPNPATANINVSVTANAGKPPYTIQITNTSGFLVRQVTSAQPLWQTSVTGLMPGTYIVKVHGSTDNTIIGDTKFVKL